MRGQPQEVPSRLVRTLSVALALVAFTLLSPAPAPAEEIGPEAFEAPVLDGVRADPDGAAGLNAYDFLGAHDWPALRLHARTPLDWSGAASLSLPIENPSAAPFRLLLRIDDDPHATGDDRSLTGIVDLAPHQRATLVLRLDARPLGMRARPPADHTGAPGELTIADVRGSLDLHHVMALHISGMRTGSDRRLLLGRPTLRSGARSFDAPLVDPFGQARAGFWPEKIASDAELRMRWRDAEAETLRVAAAAPIPADRFGGLEGGRGLPATGFFRVAKTNGRWALVTPAGHRFFSLGVDEVTSSNPTRVAGRGWMFERLPGPSSPLARYAGPFLAGGEPETFDFGAADIERALGPGWDAGWKRAVLQRLRAWGFNTLGNWSEASVVDSRTMPYVSFFDFEGASAEVPMSNGRSLPDPFDRRFSAVADAVASAMTTPRRNDPFLIGYFSGNELPWSSARRPDEGIAVHVLALGAASPAKQALVDELRTRYRTSSAFAEAWGMPAPADWAEVLARPLAWPAAPKPSARRDAAAFAGRFADLYFRTVAQAIKRHDPDHLYLGTRFADFSPEVVRACAKWCDVMSFNVYGRSPEEEASAWRGLDRPVLIGEFHFGSTDRGPFWPGMVDVGAEAERGPAYAAYLAAAVADPNIIGCHWFRYADEPATGRPYDGENGHIGLVGITDLPFAGFVSAVAAANRRALLTFADQGAGARRGAAKR